MSALALIAALALQPPAPLAALTSPSAPAAARATNPLAAEPAFADIIARATALKSRVEAYRSGLTDTGPLPAFDAFKSDARALWELDQTGSDTVRARGVDGDLACILQGISLDMRHWVNELETASTRAERDGALKELIYLLRDNVEVIQAPPAPPV